MKINRLKLRGSIGIKKGLNLEEINIDLSKLSGLIAISGPNGAGKTSLIDNFHPFRTLPSRKGALKNHFYLRDSFKELEFVFDENQYRSLVKIDSESERSEGYLWRNGESLIDGKVTNYDKKIAELFGSPELFFNSIFCHQNSKKLNEMTTGDLKKLFSEFLRLDQLIEYENTSKQCALLLGNKLEKLEPIISQLSITVQDKEDVTIAMGSAKVQLDMATASLKRLKIDLETEQENLQKTQAAMQKNELLQDREKELNAKAIRLKNESEAFEVKAEAEISVNLTKIRDTELEIMGLDSLLANEKEIREAAKRVKELTEVIEETKKQGVEAREAEEKAAKKYNQTFKDRTEAETRLRDYRQATTDEVHEITNKIKICKLQMSDLSRKDPDCQSQICSFIVSALEAEKQLPILEKELTEWISHRKIKTDKYLLDHDRLKKGTEETKTALENKSLIVNDIAKIYKALDAGLKKNQTLANELPRTEVAAQRKDDYKKRLEELRAENAILKHNHAKERHEIVTRRAEVVDYLDKITKDIDTEAKTRHDQITQGIEKLKLDINNCDAGLIPSLQADITAATRRLEEIEVAEKELERAKVLRQMYLNESSEWAYLKNACSKDGLRALEIDSVAPVVTGYANDLLISTFGPSSTIRFKTQDEETLREVLDILVIREDGTEVLLDDLSGGEKVYNLKALRLAMTLVSKEKSGMNFLCAMADEEDGALDVENAINFVGLYRSFMKSGQFDTCFYISHKPDCVAMADHVINLNGNGIEID